MGVYLLSLPIWNFVLPAYAFWHFDDFSWGDTRRTNTESGGRRKPDPAADIGAFDPSLITMKRWVDFEQDRRLRGGSAATESVGAGAASTSPRPASQPASPLAVAGRRAERRGTALVFEDHYG